MKHKTLLFLFTFIFFNEIIKPQEIQAYLQLVTDPYNPDYLYVVDSWYRSDPWQVYWGDTYFNSIPIRHFDPMGLPANFTELAIDSINTQVTDAMSQWSTSGCKIVYYDDESTGIYSGFTDNSNIFVNEPAASGFTALAVDWDIDHIKYLIVINNIFSYTIYQLTSIFLNNSAENPYTWSTSINFVNNTTVNFEYVFLHEMGHLLGLGHRQNVSSEQSVMDLYPNLSNPLFSLTQFDIEGIRALCAYNGQNSVSPIKEKPLLIRQQIFFEFDSKD